MIPAHLEAMWAADRASAALGMRLVSAAPGRAVVEMVVTDDHLNGFAIGHGGLTFALADSAFALACNSHGAVAVAHSAQIRFHAPVRPGDELVASATERSVEGRRGVYDVEVRAGERVVASFVGHSTAVAAAADPPA